MRTGILTLVAGTLLVASAASAQPYVYAANADSDDVTVINAATNTVATTIDVGDEPRNPAAVSYTHLTLPTKRIV